MAPIVHSELGSQGNVRSEFRCRFHCFMPISIRVEPLEHHWQLVFRSVSYLVNTKGIKLVLGSRHKSLETYVDSDWGGDVTTRRSTTGHISYLHGSAIA